MKAKETANELMGQFFQWTEDPNFDKEDNIDFARQCALISIEKTENELTGILSKLDTLTQLVTGFKTDEDFNENLNHVKQQIKSELTYRLLYLHDVKQELNKK
jgi:hypothetical protein